MMKIIKIILLFLCVCQLEDVFGEQPSSVLPVTSNGQLAGKMTRRILNGDRLHITILQSSDMSRDYAVAGDGAIDMALIGRIEVAELTVGEAASKIQSILTKDFFKEADVIVDVAQYVEGNILMIGEVARPGSIPYKSGDILTLVEAVAQSGGLGPKANGKEVRIIRWKPGSGMERQVISVDVQTMMQNLDFSHDQFLRPRDMVIVPQ
jgi:polysaccharide export outer membrane protein